MACKLSWNFTTQRQPSERLLSPQADRGWAHSPEELAPQPLLLGPRGKAQKAQKATGASALWTVAAVLSAGSRVSTEGGCPEGGLKTLPPVLARPRPSCASSGKLGPL